MTDLSEFATVDCGSAGLSNFRCRRPWLGHDEFNASHTPMKAAATIDLQLVVNRFHAAGMTLVEQNICPQPHVA